MLNICIIHFNTPLLTECLIKSINKYTPDSHIYIFDNSDKTPLTYRQENLTYFDNTKGKIIDFDTWLKKYPNKNLSHGKLNKWGSAKHAYSVEKCIDLIGKSFILLDSDVLLVKDITPIFNENVLYVAEIQNQPKSEIKRVIPFITFLNVPMMKANNVHYFDDDYMHGLRHTTKNKNADMYDTGGALYILGKKLPHKEIKYENYVTHFRGGSWKKGKDLSDKEWLSINKKHWGEMNKKVVYTCITGSYDIIREPKTITPDYDYVCFTDNTGLTSNVWEIRPLPEETAGLSNVKKQRYVKINAHKVLPEYNMSLWIDANITIKKDLNEFTAKYCNKKGSIFIPKHPSRNCTYKEAIACIKIKKDTPENINPQIEFYKKEGFPNDYGMVQSNVILRKHNNPECVKLMDTWWSLLKQYSHRDQLSFNYALWKTQTEEFVYMDKNACRCDYLWWDIKHGTNVKTSFVKKPQPIKASETPIQKTSSVKEKVTKVSQITSQGSMEILNITDSTAGDSPKKKYYTSVIKKKKPTAKTMMKLKALLSSY